MTEDIDALVPPDEATLEVNDGMDASPFDGLAEKADSLIEKGQAAPVTAPATATVPSPGKTEAEPAPAKAAPAEPKPTQADEEILKALDNGDVVLTVKGKSIPIRDLPKEELSRYVQMGVRFSQKMQEVNAREAEIDKKARTVMEGTKIVEKYLKAASQAPPLASVETAPPPELAPNAYDSDDVKALKERSLAIWQENQVAKAQINSVGTQMQANDFAVAEREFFAEIDAHKPDYPAASIDEVIAVKALYPEIPLERLMAKSNEKYSSPETIDTAFKANPAMKREFEERTIKEYLAKQSSGRIPASTRAGGAPPTAAPARKAPEVVDFDTLADRAKAAVAAGFQTGD